MGKMKEKYMEELESQLNNHEDEDEEYYYNIWRKKQIQDDHYEGWIPEIHGKTLEDIEKEGKEDRED